MELHATETHHDDPTTKAFQYRCWDPRVFCLHVVLELDQGPSAKPVSNRTLPCEPIAVELRPFVGVLRLSNKAQDPTAVLALAKGTILLSWTTISEAALLGRVPTCHIRSSQSTLVECHLTARASKKWSELLQRDYRGISQRAFAGRPCMFLGSARLCLR